MARAPAAALLLLLSAAAASGGRPGIDVLGTLDLLLVETTPVDVAGELWLFESVRPDYWNNTAGHEYLRFVHMQSGRTSASFGAGHGLGSAIVMMGPCPPKGVCGVFAFATRRSFGDGSPSPACRAALQRSCSADAAAAPGASEPCAVCAGHLQHELRSAGCSHSDIQAYCAGSSQDGQVITAFWTTGDMETWYNLTVIDFSKDTKGRSKRTVFNTSVGKGLLNGTQVYVMAYEWSRPGTPGGWNTNFAVSTDLLHWELLPDEFAMPEAVEHADPTLRYADGYWYCIPARKSPSRWYFFQEIYRSTDLKHWEAAPGMGSPTAEGTPLLAPDPTKDRALAGSEWLPDAHNALQAAGSDPRIANWTQWEDCNSSDMDLVEINGTTLVVYNWGCQHTTEALALAVSPMPLDAFLNGWFESAAS